MTIIFTATSSRYLSKSLFLDKIILEEYFFLEALNGPSHPGQLEPGSHGPFTAFLSLSPRRFKGGADSRSEEYCALFQSDFLPLQDKEVNMEQLIEYLKSIPKGPISDASDLEILMKKCWHEFDGSDVGKTWPSKLIGRMEDIAWDPPILTFKIERHGGTVMGSTRADLHLWKVNIEKGTADFSVCGYRQIYPRQPNLNVTPIAEEIVGLIVNRDQDSRLKWNKDGSVTVLMGKILPEGSAVAETLIKRRKRLRTKIEQLLGNHVGWHTVRANVYKRAIPD